MMRRVDLADDAAFTDAISSGAIEVVEG